MIRLLAAAILLVAPLLAAPAAAQALHFGLFGDVPYNARERAQLPRMMEEMDRDDLAFVVHDGDIKDGRSECSDAVMRDILGLFQSSAHPLVYVPGDNEWTDCHRQNNGAYDPLERLARLRQFFFADDQSLGRRRIALERQSADPQFAAWRENVRWAAGGALFVGMNVPGSDNNFRGTGRETVPSREYLARSRANRAWLAQSFEIARARGLRGLLLVIQGNPEFEAANAGHPTPGYREFIAQLREETRAFAGEVVLVHGDTHHFRIDQPLLEPRTREPLANFTRVETFGSPFIGWVRGSADPAAPRFFSFEARPYRAQ